MRVCWSLVALGALLLAALCAHGDELELLNGQRIRGVVVEETEAAVTMRVSSGDGAAQMRFATSKVHAITVGGKRRVLNEKPASAGPRTSPKAEDNSGTAQATTGRVARSRADVQELIKQAGATPPDWFEATPLEYPPTLDLSWPERPQGPWDPAKNVGQYLWSTINENPSRWKSGIRFLHHLLTVHKDNPGPLCRTLEALGSSYFNLMQDWARAAFWWEKLEQRKPLSVFNTVRLAECYWRLGSKQMAVEKLREVDRYVSGSIVKLWADMGEVDKALKLAHDMTQEDVKTDAGWVAEGHLLMGDTYRLHGRFREAIAAYQKVLAVPAVGKQKGRVERNQRRAQANIDAIKLSDALDIKRVPDGTYRASSIAYAGPLEVAVTVAAGRIEAVKVTRTEDKQYYASLAAIPKQIVDKQSVKGIDAVTCATITSEAIVNATAKALAGAMR